MSSISSPTTITPGSIVVGVDGSASSTRALDWAVRQAVLEHRPLALVHAAHLGVTGDGLWETVPGAEVSRVLEDLAATGRALLADTAARVRDQEPSVEVQEVLSTDDPRDLFLGGAATAAMTALGSRGLGPVKSLLLGSVSLAVSKHATGPVVIVRETAPEAAHGGVVVDVDGTADSVPAIGMAYRTAAFRSLPLTALHVFWDAVHRDSEEHTVRDDEAGLGDVRALLSESVVAMQEQYPEVDDRLVLQRGFRDRQLIRAAETAALVVVGARHRGRIDDFLHASVAATVVEHARCDVAVVPAGTP
ncbi:universal stress protein [Nocardioides sp. AX2bis]|uniref:universal stress protein n=1 Tax=Nocardioides sp. AX2bis TaxID=2653157 RepID=UPI0012F173ED|nr:universal stress protein [Nocardioides sp. AX2bis]VXC46513.1 Universal stress protein family [Nocardioides sp. AX2bis]